MHPFVPTRGLRITALALAISLGTTSCATVDNFSQNNSTAVNCLVGGALGAAIGIGLGTAAANANDSSAQGKRNAQIAGAVVGGFTGCQLAIMYKNRLERLDQIAKEENLRIQTESLHLQSAVPIAAPETAGIVAQVEDQGMFPSGSDRLSAEGERQLRKLASAFVGQADTAILVVGHTDSTGSADTNQKLSERRARAVADLLASQGIARERMYFQGAGASRPVADNSDPLLRGKNRRVEIVEMTNVALLAQRAMAEENNAKYLAHGTADPTAPVVASRKAGSQKSTKVASKPSSTSSSAKPASKPASSTTSTASIDKPTQKAAPATTAARTKSGTPLIDFGGSPATSTPWNLGQQITPKSGGFALIGKAYASEVPVSSCEQDRPRQAGEVISLATGQPLEKHATTEYLPGYNNQVWANLVNGHLVTISPVSILREGAAVDKQPFIEIVKNYQRGKQQPSTKVNAVANAFEGESTVLYRVFSTSPDAAVSCMDVVFSKGNAKANGGALFYPQGNGEAYTADFLPIRG